MEDMRKRQKVAREDVYYLDATASRNGLKVLVYNN